jgi:FMN-dependent NADH-azoreductase
MKLLHVDSSILGGNSVSRRFTRDVVDEFRRQYADVETTYRDLARDPVTHLTGLHLAPDPTAIEDAAAREDFTIGRQHLEEFLAADIVVIGAPMYNFGIPSQLKAWIDRLAVAGKTFSYSEAGVQGLAGGKQVVVVSTRGGYYGAETPMGALDHQENYLKAIFGFFGITDIRFVRAEGLAVGDEHRAQSLASAQAQVAAL